MTGSVHLSPHVGVIALAYARLSQQVAPDSSEPSSSALTPECRETLVNVMANCVVSLNREGCITGRMFKSELVHYLMRHSSEYDQNYHLSQEIDRLHCESIRSDFRADPIDFSFVQSLDDLRGIDILALRKKQLISSNRYCDSCASDAIIFSLIYGAHNDKPKADPSLPEEGL